MRTKATISSGEWRWTDGEVTSVFMEAWKITTDAPNVIMLWITLIIDIPTFKNCQVSRHPENIRMLLGQDLNLRMHSHQISHLAYCSQKTRMTGSRSEESEEPELCKDNGNVQTADRERGAGIKNSGAYE